MHKVRKKFGQKTQVWRLGENSYMEKRLLKEKKITRNDDGTYTLMSLEAVRGGNGGEAAQAGDWFRVEQLADVLYPFPMTETFVRNNFRHLSGDEFEVVPKVLDAWFADDKIICAEVEYLMQTGRLIITKNDPKHYFLAPNLWGAKLSAPKDSAIIFYEVKRTQSGKIFSVDWNLVARFAFERDYILIE